MPDFRWIRSVDAGLFTSGNADQRANFAAELWDSLEQDGFVKVRNHGIPGNAIQGIFNGSKRFFELPLDTKLAICHQPGQDPQRGYSRFGEENAAKLFAGLHKPDAFVHTTDAREHFDIGSDDDIVFPNRWPEVDSIPTFRSLMTEFYEACNRSSMVLLEALELAAGAPAGSFAGRCQMNASELRLNFYPAADITAFNGSVSRIGAHTDLGVVTCLFQDGLGGLEAEDRRAGGAARTFHPILSAADEMIFSVSETMQRWTNDRLRAGIHRVTTPAHLQSAQSGTVVPERFSIPFFVKADHNVSVAPIEHFIGMGNPPRYEDMTALQYHQKRVAEAY